MKNKLLVFFIILLNASILYGENFKAVTDLWNPFAIFTHGEFSGIGIELLDEIVKRTGDTVEFEYFPNKRALREFEKNEADMMVIDSPFWSDPAKDNYVFTDTIMSIKEYAYSLKACDMDLKKPEDLYGKIVNVIAGYYYPMFEDAFDNNKLNKEEVATEKALLMKLILKRCDVIFMDSIAFNMTVFDLNLDPDIFKQGLQLSDTTLGIKIRKEKAYILPRFNKAIADMKKDGTIENIIKKYIPKYE